jgi:hypothetical protein
MPRRIVEGAEKPLAIHWKGVLVRDVLHQDLDCVPISNRESVRMVRHCFMPSLPGTFYGRFGRLLPDRLSLRRFDNKDFALSSSARREGDRLDPARLMK